MSEKKIVSVIDKEADKLVGSAKLFDGFFLGDSSISNNARFISNHVIQLVITISATNDFDMPQPNLREKVKFEYYTWKPGEKVTYRMMSDC